MDYIARQSVSTLGESEYSFGVSSIPIHLLTELATHTYDVNLAEAMVERSRAYRGVRFVHITSSTVALEFGVTPNLDINMVLKDRPARLKKKLMRELRRVRTMNGGFPNRMNDGAFANALIEARAKNKPANHSHDVINWLRSARENSRRSDFEGRWENESLEQYVSRRMDRGTHPSSLPAKFSVPGELIGIEVEFVPPVRPDDCVGTTFKYPVFFGADYTYDGSVKNYANEDMETDNECRMLLRHGRYTRLYRVCAALVDGGCTVNDTCGMHVHLDARDMSNAEAHKRAVRLRDSLPLLAGFTEYTRFMGPRAERYCKAGMSPSEGGGDHYDPDRYYAINLCALRERGTVEVRMHHATLDPTRIEGWTRLLRFLFRSNMEIPLTQEALLKCDGLAEAMGPCMSYVTGPWNRFHATTMAAQLFCPVVGHLEYSSRDPFTTIVEEVPAAWAAMPGPATSADPREPTLGPAPTVPTSTTVTGSLPPRIVTPYGNVRRPRISVATQTAAERMAAAWRARLTEAIAEPSEATLSAEEPALASGTLTDFARYWWCDDTVPADVETTPIPTPPTTPPPSTIPNL